MTRIVLALNGMKGLREKITPILRETDYVVCADAGAAHMLELGITPHAVFGDFDSLESELLHELQKKNVLLEKFEQEKDHTDFELALDHCLERPEQELLVLFPFGGRVDHLFSNAFGLIREVERGRKVEMYDGYTYAQILVGPASADLEKKFGERLSLLSLTESSIGVTLTNCKWPLEAATLVQGSGLTIGNIAKDDNVKLSIDRGTLMVVQSCEADDDRAS